MYSIVLPILNEADNLRHLLGTLPKDCELVICDNGSTDGTLRLVEDWSTRRNIVLSRGNGTVGDAVIRGLSLATSDKIIVMDGDLSHPVGAIPNLVKALDSYDLVVASRYCEFGGNGDGFANRFFSWVGNVVALGLAPSISDRMSGFFGIRKSLIVPIRPTAKPMLELLVRGNVKAVSEVPYVFVPRQNGTSKLGRSAVLPKTLWDVFLLYMTRFRILNYMVVGLLGTILNLSIYYPLTLVWQQQISFLNRVFYLPPFAISTFLTGTFQYFLNKHWTFGDRKGSRLGYFRFWSVMGPTALLDMFLIFLLVEFLHLEPILAAILAILVVFIIRYTAANKWIWGKTK